jgi:hypothetical protein
MGSSMECWEGMRIIRRSKDCGEGMRTRGWCKNRVRGGGLREGVRTVGSGWGL